MSEPKMGRLHLRIDDASQRLLEEAADAAHLTVSSFVLQAPKQRADDVLADRAMIRLSARAATEFMAALDTVPQVNPHVLRALQRPVKADGTD